MPEIPTHDPRYQQLRQWLRGLPGFDQARLTTASADASFRRYFRATTEAGSWIIMDAPPDKEDIQPFMDVTRWLGERGVNVPRIHHSDQGLGFLLLDDFGDRAYLDALNEHTADTLYGAALAELHRIQSTPAEPLPPYDEPLLRNELALFTDWLLGEHLGQDPEPARQRLAPVFQALVDNALAQPQTFVHRDYHSRNLMVAGNRPGVIDYQDAVRGPLTYDLVSLLRDCYIRWPESRVRHWALDFRNNLASAYRPETISDEQFLRWFDLMGIQRHLKAAGIFCRLNHRDGKPGYLADIPRTLGYVRDIAPRYPETRPLAALLDQLPPQLLSRSAA